MQRISLSIALIMLGSACTDGADSDSNTVQNETVQQEQEDAYYETDPDVPSADQGQTQLIGGRSISTSEFTSTGHFNHCTITKIGPRHLLTAAHCLPWEMERGALVSHKSGLKKSFRISKASLKEEYTDLFIMEYNSEGKNPFLTQHSLSNRADWALVVVQPMKNFNDIIQSAAFLNQNFTDQPLGDSSAVRPSSEVKVIGFGQASERDGIIGRCSGNNPCRSMFRAEENRTTVATFNIDIVGDINNYFYFASEAKLTSHTNGKVTDFSFEDLGTSAIPRGLLAPGDSGGPVLNGNSEVVGVVKGSIVATDVKHFKYYNAFSSIDSPRIRSAIEKPEIDLIPTLVRSGRPFVVYGYKLNKVKLKSAKDSSVLPIDQTCAGLTAEQKATVTSSSLQFGSDYVCYIAPVVSPRQLYRVVNDELGYDQMMGEMTFFDPKAEQLWRCSASYQADDVYNDGTLYSALKPSHDNYIRATFSQAKSIIRTEANLSCLHQKADYAANRGIEFAFSVGCDGFGSNPYDTHEEAASAAAEYEAWDLRELRLICRGGTVKWVYTDFLCDIGPAKCEPWN